MAVVCNPIRIGRWSKLLVVCVCHSDEVKRETDANRTSGELGQNSQGSVWERLNLRQRIWKSRVKKRDIVKNNMAFLRSKNETVVLRSTFICSNDSIRLWWTWQFCEKI